MTRWQAAGTNLLALAWACSEVALPSFLTPFPRLRRAWLPVVGAGSLWGTAGPLSPTAACAAPDQSERFSEKSILRNRDAEIKQTPKSGKEVKCLCEAAASLGGEGMVVMMCETTKTPPNAQ